MSAKKQKKKKRKRVPSQRRELELDALKAIIERASSGPLNEEDRGALLAAVNTLAFLTQELETKGTTLARLRKIVFGSSSEKSKDVLGNEEHSEQKSKKPKEKRKGHGRRGADEYVKAARVVVSHDAVQHKERCPCCEKGKIYEQSEPSVLVRVRGVSPLNATVYEKQRLRCNLCGEVFTAESPEEVGDKKYDETATAMIGLLRYGCGLPFHRIERLGENLGIPLPSSTQWDVIEAASRSLEAVWTELVHQAAQGEVVYVDDTKMQVLALNTELQKALKEDKDARKGIFTSGIVSTVEEREIVLFFTGSKHAGENLETVLKQRSQELEPPIQMSDGLSRNTCGDFESIVASCLVHARRNFVDLANQFPQDVRHVLEQLKLVYEHEAEARNEKMSSEARLALHQAKSKPVMDELKNWLDKQFDDKLVEPNSPLGQAIQYMDNHWQELTLFLRVAGAPIDNNICERVLKRAILHRKNSLFYKTERGAFVGDLFMSLIHTAERQGEGPFDYLVALQRHHALVEQSPGDWMPWNFRKTLDSLGLSP